MKYALTILAAMDLWMWGLYEIRKICRRSKGRELNKFEQLSVGVWIFAPLLVLLCLFFV